MSIVDNWKTKLRNQKDKVVDVVPPNTEFDKEIKRLLDVTKKYEYAPPMALGLKLSEECGEVCEVLMYQAGYLAHKDVNDLDPLIEECADVMNVLLGILVQVYPNMTTRELSEQLYKAFVKKGEKYERIIGDGNVRVE